MDNLMQGKICLITGGSDGIGYAASRELARMGARVIIVGRNSAKTESRRAADHRRYGQPGS